MRFWWPVPVLVALAGAIVLARGVFSRAPADARPLPVPDGDVEVAWLHIPTAGDTWENFVWGVKRAEMAAPGAPAGVFVDDAAAFPTRTTAVPELVLTRQGFNGRVRVRWYKVTDDAPVAAWVSALAARDPAPLALVGGWSSDRARELADAMTATDWPGARPALLLATATAETVFEGETNYAPDYQPPKLIELYSPSFRFCFTNRQMADAVTDFALSDPSLRPGPAVVPGLRAVPGAAGGPWALLPWLAELRAPPPGVPAFPDRRADGRGVQAYALAWKDDPYSLDLSQRFREALEEQGATPGRPRLLVESNYIPFSTGRFARPNPYEAQVVDHVVANLPRRGERTLIVVPTVPAPARRVLSALAQARGSATRLVAVTGDGISVNTLFRDGEFAWPVRALPIPLVLFTHADPFDWDDSGGPRPPKGYELHPPRPGAVKSTVEDIHLFTGVARALVRGAFPDGGATAPSASEFARNLHALGTFDTSGNRLRGSGEYVVVVRPTPRVEGAVTATDAVIEVWTRTNGAWARRHSRPVVQTIRPTDGGAGE
jgi:hypothetical protein